MFTVHPLHEMQTVSLQMSCDKVLLKGKYRKAHSNIPLLNLKLFTFLLIPSLCSLLIVSSKRELWCVQRIPVLWFINALARRPYCLFLRNATIIITFVSVQNCLNFVIYTHLHVYFYTHIYKNVWLHLKIFL